MPTRAIKYPFIPKSTAHLESGQFWSIPLSQKKYACGRVIQMQICNGKRDPRIFLAGLMDWVGTTLPDSNAIAGKKVLEQGSVHIRTIKWNGGEVMGLRDLTLDGIEPWLFLDSEPPSRNCYLQRGFNIIGLANSDQQAKLEVFSAWGLEVIKILAKKHFSVGTTRLASGRSSIRKSDS